jgi:hypothetical protein
MNITENQKERIKNIRMIQAGVSWIGAIGGVIYANRTGGGAWRYVGYFFLGSLITGVPSQIIGTPFVNKILKEADQTKK